MFLVCDMFDNIKYGRIYNYKELYELLVDEICEDLKGNSHDYDIVKVCTEQLNELAKNNLVTEKYIIDNLQGYGWDVYNLNHIKNNIRLLKDFFGQKYDTSDFDKVIELIENGIKSSKECE